jgi:mono/diheme cytochrome c family protein
VQYVPYDNPQPGPFGGNDPTTGDNPASFYLANIVVETNRSLQSFNGGLLGVVQAQYQGRFESPPAVLPGNPTHKEVLYAGHAFNMGGCMGCHGSQGQSQGGNFSVILANGGVANMNPEPPAPIGNRGAAFIVRNRKLVSH